MRLILTFLFVSLATQSYDVICDVTAENREELLLQDPSQWPGHLEPFGSKQMTADVEILTAWPAPDVFFREYADKSKPVLFKGMAKESPAYEKFSDDYFANAPDADKTIIMAEPNKKENRTAAGIEDISMKSFIERYHKDSIYMVNELPKQYTPDVRMPAPLRCNSTKKIMSSQVTWFSSGGTKSVLHNDDVDNINCLFRGTKQLWMIEPTKNKEYVPIDVPERGYSNVDVDKVDYTKYPDFRKVDMFHKAIMEQGDCLFIPIRWFHQVNSQANADNMNLAVNVWWYNTPGHVPEGCGREEEATIDKYPFPDDEKQKTQYGGDKGGEDDGDFPDEEVSDEDGEVPQGLDDSPKSGKVKGKGKTSKGEAKGDKDEQDGGEDLDEDFGEEDFGDAKSGGGGAKSGDGSDPKAAQGDKQQQNGGVQNFFEHYERYVPKRKTLNLASFIQKLTEDKQVNPELLKPDTADKAVAFNEAAGKVFDLLDANKDKGLTKADFDEHDKMDDKAYQKAEDAIYKGTDALLRVLGYIQEGEGEGAAGEEEFDEGGEWAPGADADGAVGGAAGKDGADAGFDDEFGDEFAEDGGQVGATGGGAAAELTDDEIDAAAQAANTKDEVDDADEDLEPPPTAGGTGKDEL